MKKGTDEVWEKMVQGTMRSFRKREHFEHEMQGILKKVLMEILIDRRNENNCRTAPNDYVRQSNAAGWRLGSSRF